MGNGYRSLSNRALLEATVPAVFAFSMFRTFPACGCGRNVPGIYNQSRNQDTVVYQLEDRQRQSENRPCYVSPFRKGRPSAAGGRRREVANSSTTSTAMWGVIAGSWLGTPVELAYQ